MDTEASLLLLGRHGGIPTPAPTRRLSGVRRAGSAKVSAPLMFALFVSVGVLATVLYVAESSGRVGEGSGSSNGAPIVSDTDPFLSDLIAEIRKTMNASVDPCENFYEFACGGWESATVIPEADVAVERGFSVIDDRNSELLQEIAAEGWPLIGPLYDACLDQSTIDEKGLDFFKDEFLSLAGNSGGFWRSAGLLKSIDIDVFFSPSVTVDSKDPTKNTFGIHQGGVTFPARDYYASHEAIGKLRSTIAKMFAVLEGYEASEYLDLASAVVEIEGTLANASLTPTELSDPDATYNKYTGAELLQRFPNIDWQGYLSGFLPEDLASTPVADLPFSFLVDSPEYVDTVSEIAADLQNWKAIRAYMKFQTVYNSAPFLTSPLVQLHFELAGKFLSGITEMTKREKFCVRILDENLGDLIGRYFVQKAFAGDSKEKAEEIITLLKQAFHENLPSVEWMDDVTRKAAADKLDLISDLIGYPEKWDDYAGILIESGEFQKSLLNIRKSEGVKSWKALTKPANKKNWQMTPPTVNAYYDPTYNTINFPAGILQPVFFDSKFPAELNFGGIGMVAGHEITHGFDDNGRRFDGYGRLRSWWSDEMVKRFQDRTKCYVNFYDQFEVAGLHVNGAQTLDENIADNGGIKIAFKALQLYREKHGTSDQLLPEITNDQMFYLAYGQSWCTKMRTEYAQQKIRTDVHSPAMVRVLAPLTNSAEFAKAYNCPVGSKMNPADKCKLW